MLLGCLRCIQDQKQASGVLALTNIRIKVTAASVTIPVFDANDRSLRADALNFLSGNRLLIREKKANLVQVLKNINLDLSDGDALGVIGVNGSGKTSLLRLLAGIYAPTSGTVKVDGTVRPLLNLGSGLEPTLTGRENIKRLSMLYRNSPMDNLTDADIQEVIEFADLKEFIDLPVRTYSSRWSCDLCFRQLSMINQRFLS